MKRLVIALMMVGLLGGCGALGKGKKKTTPTIGERIAVLGTEAVIEVDPTLAGVVVTVPPPIANADWPQPGGNPAKSMTHVELGNSLGLAWRVSIGEGSNAKARLAAAPVVGDGKIFTIDTEGVVRASSPQNGAQLWAVRVRGANASAGTLFGGGVSYDSGRVYVTNGAGYAAALDANNGAQVWIVQPGGPLRGAPTIANNNVYVVSQDNQLYALNPADGTLRWPPVSGTLEIAGVFGSGAPAAAQGTVVAGFSSGELNAYRYENGRVLWQDALTRTSISTTVTSMSDIDASPVIDSGRVYAIGQGGRMVGLELVTGQRIWEINIAGIATPWVAGDWVYVVNDNAQLLAVARTTGKIRWMTQLTRWRDAKDKKGPIRWVGPLLAGGRLVVANSLGQIANISPADGSIQSTINSNMPITLSPIVANNTLYILHDNGQLTAWR